MPEPAALKKIRLAAEAMGMETFQAEGIYVKPAVLWSSNKDGHRKGDVRTPAKEMPKYVLRARHKMHPDRFAFEVIFAGGFHQARVIDPVGKPIELWFDYSKRIPDGWTREYARERAAQMDADYNDGHMWVKNRYYIENSTEFLRWMDMMLEALKIDYKKLAPQRKLKSERTLMDDVMDAVNS